MRSFALIAVAGLMLGLAVACGGDEKDTTPSETAGPTAVSGKFNPRPGNSELVVGPNRVAIAVTNEQNEPLLGGPENSVQVAFDGGESEEAAFVEAIPDTSGFWVLRHTFDAAGQLPAVITVTSGDNTQDITVTFEIQATSETPMIGASAPPTDNPTLASQPNTKQLTTDTDPNDAFYQLTVTEALAAQKPFVVVFATPAFCQTALCGPVLENVKAVQPEFADSVNFIHIEPYALDAEGGLAEGQLTATQSTNDWHLRFEPWIFVVGADGKISDRFEGSASPEELRASIQGALG
jgi:hypothetical protein